jgi:hypothetical protein
MATGTEPGKDRRSPIRDDELPLRYPGQGLDKMADAVFDKAMLYILLLGFFPAICFLDWLYSWGMKPAPVMTTAVAVVAVGFCIYKLRKFRQRLQDIRLGRIGERVVGQMLERLRRLDYEVFHDIPTGKSGSNIDHVLVTPYGVLAIETKTRSKPAKGKTDAWLEGDFLKFSTGKYDPDAVGQALAMRKWLSIFLQKETGAALPVPVQAILMLPGWYVDSTNKNNIHSTGDLWLLNDKPYGLVTYLGNEPERLSRAEMDTIIKKMEEYIRKTMQDTGA